MCGHYPVTFVVGDVLCRVFLAVQNVSVAAKSDPVFVGRCVMEVLVLSELVTKFVLIGVRVRHSVLLFGYEQFEEILARLKSGFIAIRLQSKLCRLMAKCNNRLKIIDTGTSSLGLGRILTWLIDVLSHCTCDFRFGIAQPQDDASDNDCLLESLIIREEMREQKAFKLLGTWFTMETG